ncbi:RMD1 family protein [Candidatus Bathyarchaeota archaeon]|nr:RMD1 family protein [Candidatus Bathyarchaeota archaeon]
MDDHTDPALAETAPLIPPASPTGSRPARTVTFSPNPATANRAPPARRRSPHGAGSSYPAFSTGAVNPTVLAALNNRLRRRNSGGSIPAGLPAASLPKLGPQRSSKTAQKLKLLPEPDIAEEEDDEPGEDEVREREVYSQFARIKDPTARRDAARLGKADRERLPRVTAYCTANRYSAELLLRFLKGRGKKRGANPKLIDECIYTPYRYSSHEDSGVGLESGRAGAPRHERRHSADLGAVSRGYEPGPAEAEAVHDRSFGEFPATGDERVGNSPDFDTAVHTPEVFAFDYGVVVVWGMTVAEEKRFLKEISRFEIEPLSQELIETEEFNFYYTREYQPRIYNDFITLRDKHSYMTKLAISHALAQSVKVSPLPPLLTRRKK